MAGNTHGCTLGREAVRPPVDASNFIAKIYYEQAADLLRRGAFAEAEPYLREVIRIWPRHAGAWNNLGTSVWQQGRLQEAEEYYRRALSEDPGDFGILNNLGNALWEQSRPGDAVEYYRRALRLRPDSPETQTNYGVALSDLGEFDEALKWLEASVQHQPHSPEALDNVGMTLARQGRWDEAMVWYERALAVRPDFPEAHRNRAYAWLIRGDYERGWPELEWRLWCRNHRMLPVPCPFWRGEEIAGRTILLQGEQGHGDILQFLRFACAVKRRGARVVLACPDSMVRLAERCPGVDHAQDWYAPLSECDVHAPLMSLPAILGTTLASLPGEYPYLSPDAATVERWRPVVGRSLAMAGLGGEGGRGRGGRDFKIGIAWQGNPRNRNDRWRSFPLALFEALARVPGVRLISLQKGEGIEQVNRLDGRFPVAVLPDRGADGGDGRDFLDTASVMSLVDLVIAPESAVAHLAGSLGIRTWVPLPMVADWRWLQDRDDSPWYPSITLFRQDSPGDWTSVFERMAGRLEAELRDAPRSR